MKLDIQISDFSVKIKSVIRDDNIKGFVTWIFRTNQGDWKVYGGTIKLKSFGKNDRQLLSYDPPAYKTKGGFNKAFFIDNLELYKKLCNYTVKIYCEISGELGNDIIFGNEIDKDN